MASLLSFSMAVLMPIAVAILIFRNGGSRPMLALWFLAAIGGPIIYGFLSLMYFPLFQTNIGYLFADSIIVMLVSPMSATICALSFWRNSFHKNETEIPHAKNQ